MSEEIENRELMDTTRAYATPEGIVLQLRLAGPVARACAWAIDFGIRLALYMIILMVGAFFGGLGMAAILIGMFLVEWFYPVGFEVHSGATPGKKAMGLQVIHDNGTPISLPSSLIRNLLLAADFMPLMYGAGLTAMLSNNRFQRLGDLAAGTLVVYREKREQRPEIPAAPSMPPPPDFNVDELRHLLDFAERGDQLSPERRSELASLLQPITGVQGDEAVTRLWSYANWLARGR